MDKGLARVPFGSFGWVDGAAGSFLFGAGTGSCNLQPFSIGKRSVLCFQPRAAEARGKLLDQSSRCVLESKCLL